MNYKFIYLFSAALLLTYVIVRAATIGITYDEAWTINSFVPLNLKNILLFSPCDANNHLLNTLLIKLLFIFDQSLFIARLPNILAFVIYLYYSYKICEFFNTKLMAVLFYLLMLSNPFILDFFGLARGYGISLALQVTALYFLLKYLKTNKYQMLWFAVLASLVSVLSNFTFLYFYSSLAIVIIFVIVVNKKPVLKISGIIALSSILLFMFIFFPLQTLIKNQSLYYGGHSDIYSDTLISLLSFSLYQPNDFRWAELLMPFLILVFATLVLLFINGYRRKLTAIRSTFSFSLFLIFALQILSTIANHFISGTPYLTDRTALQLLPVFMTAIFFLADETKAFPNASKIIISLLTFLSVFNLVLNLNFFKVVSWEHEAHTEKILNFINQQKTTHRKLQRISYSWVFENSVNYYLKKNRYRNLETTYDVKRDEDLYPIPDYYIHYTYSLDKVGYFHKIQHINNFKKDTILKYPREGVYVFKNLRK